MVDCVLIVNDIRFVFTLASTLYMDNVYKHKMMKLPMQNLRALAHTQRVAKDVQVFQQHF